MQEEIAHVNAELTSKNIELERRIQEKSELIAQNVNFMQISLEILENLANAVIGIDMSGMITLANQKANALFDSARLGTLLGTLAAERLPAEINDCLRMGRNSTTISLADGHSARVWIHTMGAHSESKGVVVEIVLERGSDHEG